MAKSFGLGRGLDALIPRGASAATAGQAIPIERVRRNPHQPRADFDDDALAELTASIATHGVLQPIVVRETADGGYELIAGERRLRAARAAGMSDIPAVIRDSTANELLILRLEDAHPDRIRGPVRAEAHVHLAARGIRPETEQPQRRRGSRLGGRDDALVEHHFERRQADVDRPGLRVFAVGSGA